MGGQASVPTSSLSSAPPQLPINPRIKVQPPSRMGIMVGMLGGVIGLYIGLRVLKDYERERKAHFEARVQQEIMEELSTMHNKAETDLANKGE
jgi:hypothetical protein